MTKHKAFKLSSIILAAIVALLFVVGAFFGTSEANGGRVEARVGERILLASGDNVVLMDNGTSAYETIVFGTAPHAGVAGEAKNLSDNFYTLVKVEPNFISESSSTPTTNVITYGRVTNVPLSVRLADTIEALPADSIAWGIAYENGVLAIYANSKAALNAQTSKTLSAHELYTDLYAALSEYVSAGKFTVPETLFRVQEITKAEYDEIIANDNAAFDAEEDMRKAQKIESLKNAIANEFVTENFGTPETGNTLTTDFGSHSSGAPAYYPTTGEHPRVLFTEADIPAIRASIEAKKGTAEYDRFMQYIDVDYGLTGILGAPKKDSRGYHNWNGTVLSAIQANALAYAIYGDEFNGYTAIYAIKNYLMTLDVDCIVSDQCREFGMVMYIAACVYDWCYDLLTPEDKIQIPLGVEHRLCRGSVKNTQGLILSTSQPIKMEMGFPPTNQAALVGHGSEFQLMRDYLAMSIAVYDEMPGWYEFVGGRMYNEYIPVRQQYYSAGLYPQGMSCYAPWRFLADCFGAALIQAATGRSPYSEDMAQVVFTFASNETAAGKMFSTGDGSSTSLPSASIGMEALVISHVLYDTASAPLLRLMSDSLITNCTGSSVSTVLCPEYFIFTAREVEKMENTTWRDELPRVTYTGDYVGQYLVRNEWTDNAAVIMMRVGERTTVNHDHEDAGTFQIYYKGLTTGSSGGYGTYGSDHWAYYHQATVAHNGILIFDSSKADTVPQTQDKDGDGNPDVDGFKNIIYSNESRLFYSGGQSSNNSEPSNLQSWLNGSHDRADVKGYASGYGADGVTPKFAYVMGDISKAYSSSQSSFVGRSMLTAYTGDPDYPMVFFVFDRIDAMDEDFVKKFLLQINGENAPVIDQDNKTVKVEEGNGQLVLQNVLGADKIEGIGGGYGSNFIINGVNCQDNSFKNQTSWGRVELSTTGNLSDLMLNVIYVSDKGNTNLLKATGIKGVDKKTGNKVMLEGATIGNVTALFSTEIDRTVEQIVFTADGDGLMTYYVGGLFEGTWNISVEGKKVGTVYSTYNSGFISFKAPAGKEITLTPGNDIRPAGSEKLTYVTMGGTFDKKVDSFYMPGEGTALYTGITRGFDIFEGWYLDREYTIPANPIPTDITGPLTVYAKWTSIFANEDYTSAEINIDNKTSGGTLANGVQYNISDGAYTTYKTETTDSLGRHLFWQTLPNPASTSTEGQKGRGPSLFVKPAESSIASMSGEQITYIFKLADAATTADMEVNVRVRNEGKKETNFFTVKAGKVLFNDTEVASLSENKFVTVSVVLDFANNQVRLYTSTSHDEYSKSVTLEPRSTYTTELLSMRSSSEGAIRVGLIQVYEGDKGEIIKGTDVPRNYIEFPSDAIIPDGTNLEFIPNGATVIPTEGITTVKGGIKHVLEGWYSDAALQNPVTTVPDGVTDKFTVYAKWREANVIYFPDEAGIPNVEYVAGVTELPSQLNGVQDGYNVTLLGWYLDEAFTQPVTVVPAGTEGAFFVYAKWQEPNYIKYPDGVTLPDGAPTGYVSGVATPLPETATNGISAEFKFLGWYLDEAFTEQIYEIPANASGKFEVYAKWEKVVTNFAPDTETSGGPVIGYGYCATHSDTDNNGICEVCGFCTAGCADVNVDGKCDKCTHAVGWCGNSADKHPDADGNKKCDVCNIDVAVRNTGKINGINFEFNEFVPGNMTVIDNGDNDYARLYVKSGNGPSINSESNLAISDILKNSYKHQLVYQLELAAEEDAPVMPFYLRIRKDGSPIVIFGLNAAGDFLIDERTVIEGRKISTEMTKVSIVVDFDNGEIRYYFGNSIDPVAKKAMPMPPIHTNVEGWLNASFNVAGYGLMQNRIQGPGTLLIGGIKIFADDDGEYDVSNNQIIYPEGIPLPSDAPKSYKPGVTELPTDVEYSFGDMKLDFLGWYADENYTTPITKIPQDASGEYRVYAKWSEANVISYPDNIVVDNEFPVVYVAGETILPTNVSSTGKYGGTFVGWYADKEYTQKITKIPADASGVYTVYALFEDNFYLLDVEASASTGTVIGYGYCVTHSDTNDNGVCEICNYCTDFCTDSNADSKCDKCGFKPTRCGTADASHTDANSDKRCDVCNINFASKSTGSLGLDGIGTSFAEYVPGYATVVDNGNDDYIEIFVRNDNGPTLNYSGEGSVNSFIGNKSAHRIVYTFELARKEGEPLLEIGFRLRLNGQTGMIFGTKSDGSVYTDDRSTKIPGYTIGTEMTTVKIVIDFDEQKIRYYFGDSIDHVAERDFARPAQYATTEDWLAGDYSAGTTAVLQMRYQNPGYMRIGKIAISSDYSGRYVVSDNQIKYPAEAELPLGAPKAYIAGETKLPTDVTTTKNGVIYELEGWYSDEALQNKITVVPDGASGEYQVYAKWVEKNYVIYPTEANLPDTMPREYAPGVSAIPLPTEGVTGNLFGKTVTLAGWYADEALTQPVTEIPVTATGAFRVYAKWNEPNTISYPSSVKVDSSFPEDYVAGETALPENPQYNGAGEAIFVGWYADEACTQKITVVPANAVGVFKVYAVFSKTLLDLDVEASDATGSVVGYNYCEHSDTNSNGICEVCFRCLNGCKDGSGDNYCDTCGMCVCSYASNGKCTYCGENKQSGALGLSGVTVNFSDNAPGYVAVVENGDSDYTELYIANGNGPQYNYGGTESINTLLAGMDRHVLVYSFELGAKANTPIMNAQFRFRPNNSATSFFEVKTDGTLTNCGGAKISADSLTKVIVAVDFDNQVIRYYLGDSTEAVGTKAWTKPAQFATTEEWLAAYYTIAGYGAFQVRMSSTGTILIGDISITANDARYI